MTGILGYEPDNAPIDAIVGQDGEYRHYGHISGTIICDMVIDGNGNPRTEIEEYQ